MPIYTRTGDKGQTSLANGQRVKKTDCLVEIFGNLDELNCLLGIAQNFVKTRQAKSTLPHIQNLLFNVGAQIAQAPKRSFRAVIQKDVDDLERGINKIETRLTPLKNFILPGGLKSASFLHLSRAVCRRVERSLIKDLNPKQIVNPNLLPFINRLSDYLFVLARLENKKISAKEVLWKGK